MDITGLSALGSTNTGSQSGDSAVGLAEDFQTFLTLLTAQLQAQDPLDPMKSNEFTQQLVQFAGVEQQIRTNQHLEDMASAINQSNISGIASYLGQEALIQSDQATNDGSGAEWQYDLKAIADAVQLRVVDESGTIVHESAGATAKGIHNFNWDGTNFAGDPVDTGLYQLQVIAVDRLGNSVDKDIFVQDRITSIDTSHDGPITFEVGGRDVTQDEILRLIANG